MARDAPYVQRRRDLANGLLRTVRAAAARVRAYRRDGPRHGRHKSRPVAVRDAPVAAASEHVAPPNERHSCYLLARYSYVNVLHYW